MNKVFVVGADDSEDNVKECLAPIVHSCTSGSSTSKLPESAPATPSSPFRSILIDPDRDWFKLMHDTQGPSTSGWAFFSPKALVNFLGKHDFDVPSGVSSRSGGQIGYLGGVMVFDGQGKLVWQHKEARYGDIADGSALQAAVTNLASREDVDVVSR